jgi:hypothetical protein
MSMMIDFPNNQGYGHGGHGSQKASFFVPQ